MDCRKTVVLALAWLVGILGCQQKQLLQSPPSQNVSTTGFTGPLIPEDAPINPASVKKKKIPKPKTLVALGKFRAGEANTSELPPLYRQEHREVARKAFQQAIDIDPGYVPAYLGLGRLYTDMDDLDHAVDTYHQGLKIKPEDGLLWFELGMLYARQKQWDQAIPALTRAVACDPENRRSVNILGYALARTGQFEASFECFTRIYGPGQAHYEVARMLSHMGYTKEAEQELILALENAPKLSEARALLQQLQQPIHTVGHTEPQSVRVSVSEAPSSPDSAK
jgi:tetratricopeptide (TPR) repeat protein